MGGGGEKGGRQKISCYCWSGGWAREARGKTKQLDARRERLMPRGETERGKRTMKERDWDGQWEGERVIVKGTGWQIAAGAAAAAAKPEMRCVSDVLRGLRDKEWRVTAWIIIQKINGGEASKFSALCLPTVNDTSSPQSLWIFEIHLLQTCLRAVIKPFWPTPRSNNYFYYCLRKLLSSCTYSNWCV